MVGAKSYGLWTFEFGLCARWQILKDNQKTLSPCRPVAVRVDSNVLDGGELPTVYFSFFASENGPDARKIEAYRVFRPPEPSDMGQVKSR